MMTNKIEVEELICVLEEIRSSQFPEIPDILIKNIVYGEFEKQDDRVQGRKEIKKFIDDFLNTVTEV